MTTKVGFLHDYAMNLGTVLSETDSESKYSIEFEQTNSVIDNDSAELSVIDFDTSQNLDSVNGMKIVNINTGPLIDKHENYRNGDVENFHLGIGRFAIKDYADSSNNNKSKDEYWCANTFQPGYEIYSLPDTLIHNGHWNGTVMMYAFTQVHPSDSDKQLIYVTVRNESTKVWATPVLVNLVSNKVYKGGAAKAIENYPNFCTVPNLGTLLFYFGTTEDSQGEGGDAGHSNELVHISITKDNGVTWEDYGNFIIDPFYGDVAPPQSNALASEKTAVLKVIYYNNKLIVGMMLQGTDSSTVAIQERIGFGTTLSASESFTFTTKYPIKQDTVSPPTLTLRKNGNGTIGSGTQVAADNGSGTITGTNVSGTISNYKLGTIAFAETAAEWGNNDSVDVEYEIGGLHYYRILNVVYSEDLGKSWITVPYEFISASYEGPVPAGDYLIGDPSSSDYRYCLPSNFGLGYDINSDKVVLVLRSSGLYTSEDFDNVYHFNNISKTYFFYNRTDDLFEWGSSVIKGRTYRMLDSYHIDSLDNYFIYNYSTTVASDWYIDGDTLHQDANTEGPTYAVGQAKGGTHLILNKDDPTLNRTVGVHVDMMASDNDTFGIAFCRQDQNNFYAVTFDCTNHATVGTCVMYVKKVLSGTESSLGNTTVFFPRHYWMELSIIFDQYDKINVFLNGVGKLSVTDNDIRIGKIALISNSQEGCEFDNLGLHTNRTIRTIPGGGFSAKSGWYNETRPQVGANIELTNDNFGQSWIAADILTINMERTGSTNENYPHCGIAFQKYKLGRDVERVEGKFLATDSYSVILADEDHYEEDIQYFLSLQDFGLFVTHYDDATNNTTRRKPTLENFEWRYGDPNFFIYRDNDNYYQYSSALIERSQYSDRNLFANLGGSWHCMTYSVQPQYAGWEESPSFSYTQENRYILNVAKDHYFLQSYDPNTDSLNTNGNFSMPVVMFDGEYRGMTAFFKTISDSGNDTGADRTICEVTIPCYDTGTGHDRLRFRIKADDAASAGFSVDYYNYTGTSWVNLGSLYGLDIKNYWWDVAVFLLPAQRSNDLTTDLSVYVRQEGSSRWQTVIEDLAVVRYASTTPIGEIKFGAFDASAEVNNKQKFKFIGYSDTCFLDTAISAIRGESLQSGERIYATKGIVYTVSGGLSMEGDEWTLTDLTRRDNSKESVVDRPSVLWISSSDSADKSIVIDAEHELEYDTVVLIDVNCKQIVFESDDSSSFPSPTVQATLDMAEYSAIPFSTDLNKETIMNIITNNIFKINEFLDRIAFVTYSTNIEKAFRIIRNTHNRIIYDENGAAPPLPTTATTGTLDILSKNIAIRFNNRYRDRYFRITMKKSTYDYPTPEGKFQIGRVAIGVLDQLQENPEYPEITETSHKNNMIKLASNTYKQKRKATATTQKTLNFRSIDSYNQRGFLNQLKTIFGNVDGYKPVFYIPDIEEFTFSGTPTGTYTLNVWPFYFADKISYPEKWGNLSDVTIILKEQR